MWYESQTFQITWFVLAILALVLGITGAVMGLRNGIGSGAAQMAGLVSLIGAVIFYVPPIGIAAGTTAIVLTATGKS